MTAHRHPALRHALGLSALLLLGGCFGGGGDDGPAPPPPAATDPAVVPASAAASPAAFVQYAEGLAPDERGEALGVAGFVPPVTETDEPRTLSR